MSISKLLETARFKVKFSLLVLLGLLQACATHDFGRASSVTSVERAMDCKKLSSEFTEVSEFCGNVLDNGFGKNGCAVVIPISFIPYLGLAYHFSQSKYAHETLAAVKSGSIRSAQLLQIAETKSCEMPIESRCPPICQKNRVMISLTMESGLCGLKCSVLNTEERNTYSDLLPAKKERKEVNHYGLCVSQQRGNIQMAEVSFDAKTWAEALAVSLPDVLEEQDRLYDHFGLYAWHYVETAISHETLATSNIPSNSSLRLYYAALSSTGHDEVKEFEGLRLALMKSIKILANHPELSHVVDITSAERNFVVVFPEYAIEITVLHILDGLMFRGIEIQHDGFEIACRELCEVLGTSVSETPSGLRHGFHVSVIHGLRYDEEFPIEEETSIVPFRSIRHYVEEVPLRSTPNFIKPEPLNSSSAIVRPISWQPKFRPSSQDEIHLDTDWGDSFVQDSERLCTLLAISHAAPVVHVATIFYCVHRVASQLLGQRNRLGSHISSPYIHSFDRSSIPLDSCADATAEAISLFKIRNSRNFVKLEPITPRLAASVTRQGRFALEDRILDVAMALERMYELDQGEISYKLKTRAACYLESTTDARNRVFKEVKKLYDLRSAIVHGREKNRGTSGEQESTFEAGFEIARRTFFKLLREGPPSDWNQIVIANTSASE